MIEFIFAYFVYFVVFASVGTLAILIYALREVKKDQDRGYTLTERNEDLAFLTLIASIK